MKLSALINNKWCYVTLPEGYTWQLIPQRQATGYQVRVYRGAGKTRQMVAMFHCDRIQEEGSVEFDYDHPQNKVTEMKHHLGSPYGGPTYGV